MQGFYCINGTCEVVQQHIGVPLCPILVSGLSGAIFLPILVSDRSGGRKVCLVQYSYLYCPATLALERNLFDPFGIKCVLSFWDKSS